MIESMSTATAAPPEVAPRRVTIEPDEIVIIAIEHTKRRPDYWQQRL
jgi:cytochrome P450